MSEDLGRLKVSPKRGDEHFHSDGAPLDYCFQEFWRWSVSDLVSNATRGILAEFMVAKALGISTDSVRDEWAAYDLTSPEGVRVEVKSAAYLQTWNQRTLSTIRFLTHKTKAFNPDTNTQDQESKRQADVYVFALLTHKDKATIDPLNVNQWCFYVVPTATLDRRKRSQYSITLKTLDQLCGGSVTHSQLHHSVVQAARGGNTKPV